jgi:DegV family protein with EDD domain
MEPLLAEGKDILYLAFSSALSNTCNAGILAAEDLAIKYPDRKILIVDSLCASLGQGLLIYLAVMEKRKGKSIDEVRDWAEDNKKHICHWFTVDDLNHLRRGGRIPAATAILGTLLGIKPILHVDESGRLSNVSKVRGRQAAIEALSDKMAELAYNPAEQTVFISHADCIEDAEKLEKLLRRNLSVKNIFINYVGPVIGAHAGPGTLALFFIGRIR